MTEIDMLSDAIKQYGLAFDALSKLQQDAVISEAEEDAAGDELVIRMAALRTRRRTLAGGGVTPIADTGQVKALTEAVKKLAAYNAAAGAWSKILDTVLKAGDAIKAVSSGGWSAAKSAQMAGTPMLDRATLALVLAGVAAAGAVYAATRNRR